MRFELNGHEVHASTGGRDHKDGQEYLIFLHGAGSSHLVWSQQSRSFAYAGYNVLAVDFPGHNLSGGDLLPTVEEQANWVVSVMDHLGIEKATLVGHSQGGLVCLEMGSKSADRVEKIIFVATAGAIPVNDMLISTAETKEGRAKSSMTAWGLGPDAHHFENTVPGFSHVGMGLRTMDLNPEGAVANDLKACAGFDGGLEKAASISCPTMCVLAGKDKMTPVKFGRKLADALPNNTLHVLADAGHTIPGERPHELNALMRDFLKG
ncbi:MAG: alpha/beta hydrolase [Rhizobiaceae bacterium]|nr:alpha/beta hydrolase [Rhizobiaceae bacterium]